MSRLITPSNKTTLTPMQAQAKNGGKLLFTTIYEQQAALLIQNDRLKAVRFFPKEQSKIGAIYICKVKNAVSNLNAYFVEIGGENQEICFLSQKDAAYPFLLNRSYDGRILEGDEFPVQVIKDAQKNKQASVTTRLSLSNDYFALSVGDKRTGYSNKFAPETKNRLKQLIQGPDWSLPTISLPYSQSVADANLLSVGLVVRTLAQTAPDNALHEAFENLVADWKTLFQTALHRTCFSCLKVALPYWQTVIQELVTVNEYEEILTDDAGIYHQILNANTLPATKQLRFYDEEQSAQLSLIKLYGLESKLTTALDRRVWLKSGAYLVIDPTEALTVIDVNSGKYEATKGTEEAFYQINREAAEEIALQLRLRNLSGIILADFINMKSQEHQNELMEYLSTLVATDHQKTVVVDMTPLGLVEITRQKGYKPLAEQINNNDFRNDLRRR